MRSFLIPILLMMGSLTACDQPQPADAWMGKWQGVEGTYMTLSKGEKGYQIIIQDLDRITTYDGVPDGAGIKFTRNNREEKILHGDGQATGMKWLADKTDCLVIKSGEGYCRD